MLLSLMAKGSASHNCKVTPGEIRSVLDNIHSVP
jgi:hypothetical protein